jgi:cGMP-dependent protein kinase
MSADGLSNEADPVVTYNQILKGMESVLFPKTVGRGAVLLIRHLCRQNPGERLGSQKGVADILAHRWFQGFDWNGLREGKAKPPIEPRLKSPRDTSNFDKFELEIEDMADDNSGWDADF